MSHPPSTGPRVVVDLDAVRYNLRVLQAHAPGARMMAIVKADAYGHGAVEVSLAAVEEGVGWLGVAQLGEALALRRALERRLPAGAPRPHVLTWLYSPGAPLEDAIGAHLDLTVSAPWALEEVCRAAAITGRAARIHLKIDTGMSRLGSTEEDFPALVQAAAQAQQQGLVEVVGLWSHLARADEPDHPATALQDAMLMRALQVAHDAGLDPLVHLAASGGILWHRATHHDMVRAGIAMYGISPDPSVATAAELGLRPALRWEAPLTSVKLVRAGTPVSYGGTEVLEVDTWLGVVPLGYADGVPRHASGTGPVQVGRLRTRVVGRVCMDQVVVDLGPGRAGEEPPARAGDLAALISGTLEGPSAEDWAEACGTIGYEIVARIGERIEHHYVDTAAADNTAVDVTDPQTVQLQEDRP